MIDPLLQLVWMMFRAERDKRRIVDLLSEHGATDVAARYRMSGSTNQVRLYDVVFHDAAGARRNIVAQATRRDLLFRAGRGSGPATDLRSALAAQEQPAGSAQRRRQGVR